MIQSHNELKVCCNSVNDIVHNSIHDPDYGMYNQRCILFLRMIVSFITYTDAMPFLRKKEKAIEKIRF